MKNSLKVIAIICFLFTFNVNAQEINLEPLFSKNWQYESIDTTAKALFKEIIKEEKDAGRDKQAEKFVSGKEDMLIYLESLLKSAILNYNKDNTLVVFTNEETARLTWQFDATNNTITTTSKPNNKNRTLKIVSLTEDKFVFISDQGDTRILVPYVQEPFDTNVLLKDLEIYRNTIETAHSGLYLYTTKTQFDVLFEDVKQKIPTLKNTREFYKLLAGIHTKINCGHSSFHITANVFSEVDKTNENAFFPFKIKFLKNTLIAAQDYKTIKKGDQIVSINSNSISEISDQTFKLLSSDGYNTTFKYRQLEANFSANYFIAFGASKVFDIQFIPLNNSEIQSVKTNAIPLTKLNETVTESSFEKPYYLEYVDNNTALLTVNTFSTETKKNQKLFFKFLKTSFKEINNKGINNLILDIRENTGGDDGNDMELASYFINTKFKENKFRKLNTLDGMPPYPEYLTDQWYSMFDMDRNVISPKEVQAEARKMMLEQVEKGADQAYYWKEKEIIKRGPAKNRFKGQVYVLTSGKVFSGGGLFSALVRDKSNAIFIGEETGGGYYRHTGTFPLIYKLPNSGLIFSLFTVVNEQDVDQKLVPNGSGTVPQYEVYQTATEFVNQQDAVLNKAKAIINNN